MGAYFFAVGKEDAVAGIGPGTGAGTVGGLVAGGEEELGGEFYYEDGSVADW